MKKLYDALFLSDTHFECHDESLVGSEGKIFKLLKKKTYKKIVHIGDLVDFDTISRFEKDPRSQSNIVTAIKMATEFLVQLREAAPKSEIYWKEGNHDQRLEKYIVRNCPELIQLECLNLKSIFQCEVAGINFVPATTPLLLDELKVTHGKAVAPQSGYSAHAEMRVSKGRSGVSGHTHRLCWVHSHEASWMELGYLGSLDYTKYPYIGDCEPNWKQGFGEGSYVEGDDGNRFWLLRPIEINNGHFMVDGVLY